jgi:hypothetical protein
MQTVPLSLLDFLDFWDELDDAQREIVKTIINHGSFDPSFRTDYDLLPEEDKVIHHEAARRYGSYMVKDLIKVYSRKNLLDRDRSLCEAILKTLFITEHTFRNQRNGYMKIRRLTNRKR